MPKYQGFLREVVEDRLLGDAQLENTTEKVVETPIKENPAIEDVLSILVDPPKMDRKTRVWNDRPALPRKPIKRNFLEIEARNRSLGDAGEKLVVEFEIKRLWHAGKKNLANRVEHVASTKGDDLGYDVLSFEESGRERLIEVKTTQFGAVTPFFASRNEVNVSESHREEYQLYRLYNFVKQPKMFALPGSLRETCELEPTQFSALPK